MGHFLLAIFGWACFAFILRMILHFALPRLARITKPKNLRERVMVHYQGKNFNAWVFAWFKTGLDSMFRELPEVLQQMRPVETFLDLGCGYGLGGCLLLELQERSIAFAVDPNAKRVAAAAAAMGDRGHVFQGSAPDFVQPGFPPQFDAAFALDMIHFLTDSQLNLTLKRIRDRLHAGDFLVIRSPVKPTGTGSLKLKLYRLYAKWRGTFIVFRTIEQIESAVQTAGFQMVRSNRAGRNPELFWFISTATENHSLMS